MRIQITSSVLPSILSLALVSGVAIVTAACSTSSNSGIRAPEARLGRGAPDSVRPGYRDGMQKLGTAGKGSALPGSPEDFKSTGADLVYFASDSVELTPEGQMSLMAQSRWLKQYPASAITLEGHADERGTREYNIALGERRATTVKQFLAAQGIPANRMRTVSYGKERPVKVCDDISCWSQNRRVQTNLNAMAVSRN